MGAIAWVVRFLTLVVVPALVAGVVFWWTEGLGSTPAIVAFAVAAGSVLAILGYIQILKRNYGFYCRSIANRLDQVFDNPDIPERTFDLDGDEKVVIFSDQHKGTRDGADDFWRAERAYCSALAYYLELRHRLIVLGDAEELWETWFPRKVISKHDGEGQALTLEAEFHAASRYDRTWGNHDLQWRSPAAVDKHLGKGGPFGEGFVAREALKLRVVRNQETLGVLFLVHGHQGTADSEVITRISRPVIRFFGFLQRRFKRGWNTPANEPDLRERHDRAMFEWAKSKSGQGVVLIAGHTHRPVFWRSKPRIPDDVEIARLQAQYDQAKQAGAPPEERAEKHADLQHARAKKAWGAGGAPPPKDIIPPSYFNTGCCSFADGDATGLELVGGEIRLVRWLDNDGQARPEVLHPATASLEAVFSAVKAYRPPR
jgi:hypothetical protein